MPFRLRTFGGLSLTGESGPVTGAATQRRKLALLAVLATAGERGVSRDRLLALFWPESDAEHARHALTQSLFALRRELNAEDLVLGQADLRLNSQVIESDVTAFEVALARGEPAQAAALYAGPFLDGIHLDHQHQSPEFERWAETERGRLAGLAAGVLERLAREAAGRGDRQGAVEWRRRLAGLDPYSSRIASSLIDALIAAGDRAGALRQAEIHSTLLRDELHVEPDGALRAVIRRLRSAAPTPAEPVAVEGDLESTAQPPGPAARPHRRVVRFLPLGLGLAAAAVGALLTERPHARAALDPDLIAVAPFDVFDPKLELWREGLVDVLSRDLDGAGPLRTVSPTVVIRRWSGHGDPDAAASLAHQTGASVAIFGALLGAGRDSVRVTATAFDVARNEVAGEIELKANSERMDLVTDSITRGVLDLLNRTRPIAGVRLSSLGSSSMPAVKAFLRGEHFYRQTAWDSAVASYRRAVTSDPNFALALSHLGQVDGWVERESAVPAQAYAFRSAALNRGLAPRDSLLIVADSLFEALRGFTDDAAWWPQSRRLFATLEQAVRRYPEDPGVWFQLGEARVHYGFWHGITRADALRAFDQAIALDSGFAPAYIHPIQLAGQVHGALESHRYASAYLALSPQDIEAEGIRLAERLLDSAAAGSAAVGRLLDGASRDALLSALDPLAEVPASWEPERELVRRIVSNPRVPESRMRDSLVLDSTFRRSLVAYDLAGHGHVDAAYRMAGSQFPELFGELLPLGVVPDDSARAQLDRWLAHGLAPAAAWGLPWWAVTGDAKSIRRFVALSDSLARGGRVLERPLRLYDAVRGRAYLALAQRDTDAALRSFEALPDSLCGGCREAVPWSHLTRAELLMARNRAADAARLLAPGVPWWPRPLSVLTALARARAADRAGDRGQAIWDYRFVAATWAHADVELQPVVAEAQAALARLAGSRLR